METDLWAIRISLTKTEQYIEEYRSVIKRGNGISCNILIYTIREPGLRQKWHKLLHFHEHKVRKLQQVIIIANVSLHRSPPAMGIVLKKLGLYRIPRECNRDFCWGIKPHGWARGALFCGYKPLSLHQVDRYFFQENFFLLLILTHPGTRRTSSTAFLLFSEHLWKRITLCRRWDMHSRLRRWHQSFLQMYRFR